MPAYGMAAAGSIAGVNPVTAKIAPETVLDTWQGFA